MPVYRQTLLLFALNLIDALLTIYWVRSGVAAEGNHLMASLLDLGDLPFLAVKVSIGATAALVLWNWGRVRIARLGLSLALVLYAGLMGVHFLTGLAAFGLISENFISDASKWSISVFALFS